MKLVATAHGGGVSSAVARVDWRHDPVYLAKATSRTFAFELEVPETPFTARGVLVSIDWALRAEVGAARSEPIEVIVLGPSPEASARAGGYRQRAEAPVALVDDEPAPLEKRGSGGLIAAGGAVVTGAMAGLGAAGTLGGMLIGGLLAAPIAGLGVLVTRSFLRASTRPLEGSSLLPRAPRAKLGETVDVMLIIRTSHWQDVVRIVAKLRCSEIVRRGSEAKRIVETVTRRGELVLVGEAATYQPGVAVTLSAKLRLPASGPPTVRSPDVEIRWDVVALIVTPRGTTSRLITAPIEVIA